MSPWTSTILFYLIVGTIVGLLGKFLAPGDQDNIPLWLTIVCGIGGMLIGDVIYRAFGGDGSRGLDWTQGLVTVLTAMVAGHRRRRRPTGATPSAGLTAEPRRLDRRSGVEAELRHPLGVCSVSRANIRPIAARSSAGRSTPPASSADSASRSAATRCAWVSASPISRRPHSASRPPSRGSAAIAARTRLDHERPSGPRRRGARRSGRGCRGSRKAAISR